MKTNIHILIWLQIMCCFCEKINKNRDPDPDDENEEENEQLDVAHRIIAGKKTLDLSNWNFIAVIEKYHRGYFKHWCDGSLISGDCILTAGNCLLNSKKEVEPIDNIIVRLGIFNIKKQKGTEAEVAGYIFHPDFDNETYENDLSIIKLLKPIKETANIEYVKFADLETMPESETCKAAGWRFKQSRLQQVDMAGNKIDWEDLFTFDNDDQYADIELDADIDKPDMDRRKRAVRNLVGRRISPNEELLEVDLPVLPHEECTKHYKDFDETDTIFCTSSSDGDLNTCTGDVGGPIVCDDEYSLMGITSRGTGCLQPESPGVYIIVSKYEDWIAEYCDIPTKKPRKKNDNLKAEESEQVTTKIKVTVKQTSENSTVKRKFLSIVLFYLCIFLEVFMGYY